MNCDDCGGEMAEPNLCVLMFSPLAEERRESAWHRVSNLCARCETLKRTDVKKAYPPKARAPVRRIDEASNSTFAFECLKNRWVPQPIYLSGKPLWLYGKGELGRMAEEYLQYAGVVVAGTFEHDEPAPLDAQVAVCIVRNAPYSEIEGRLRARGFRNVVPFYDLTDTIITDHPWKNGWLARPEKTDFIKMEEVLDRWWDEASIKHYLQFLAWRIIREEWIFRGLTITKDNMFFIPEIAGVLRKNEVFLDCGAYDGGVSAAFRKLSAGAQTIMVEPDAANRSHIGGFDEVLPFALSDLDDSALFAEGFGLCSKLSPSGKIMKRTARIDMLCLDPTFIKLHLEGGEFAAIRGAQATLLRCRPIVAARVDHNPDGLWKTADYLMNLLPNYRFLFRNHCWCASAAVVYAIPEERYA